MGAEEGTRAKPLNRLVIDIGKPYSGYMSETNNVGRIVILKRNLATQTPIISAN